MGVLEEINPRGTKLVRKKNSSLKKMHQNGQLYGLGHITGEILG